MSQPSDVWYVRFPDGRVVRAPNTHVLRQHISTGQVPLDSRVRRSADEEWVALDWTQEFADLLPQAGDPRNSGPRFLSPESGLGPVPMGEPRRGSSRLDSMRLRTVGLRGLAEELMAALDNTLSRSKLLVAATAGVLSAAVVAFIGSSYLFPLQPWSIWVGAAAALVLLTIGVISNVLLTQITYIELSQLRPARWEEVWAGLAKNALRLLVVDLVTVGGALLLIGVLRWLPGEVRTWTELEWLTSWREIAVETLGVVSLLVELVLWPMLGFSLLLGPVVVIEECSIATALRQWLGLIRQHLGRLFLYESAAFLGGVATLAFAFPVALAAWGRMENWGSFDTAIGFGLCVLMGLAAAPSIAYLAVAQVFIYLNLRYEVENRNNRATRRI